MKELYCHGHTKTIDYDNIVLKMGRFLRDTDLREIFRLVGEAFFKDWIVAATHSSAEFEVSCS